MKSDGIHEHEEPASSSLSITTRGKRNPGRRKKSIRDDEYDGPKRFCFCRLPAPRWTSWTDCNPGRRFYGCPKYNQEGGCGYFAWHDGEFGNRANTVIRQLLTDIERLDDENSLLRRSDGGGRRGDDGRRFLEEVDEIHRELRKLKRGHEVAVNESRRSEVKFKIALGALMVTWLFLFVLYIS